MGFFSSLFGRRGHVSSASETADFSHTNGTFIVEDMFPLSNKGVVLSGKVKSGGLAPGFVSSTTGVTIKNIEHYNKHVDFVVDGDHCGLLVDSAEHINSGDTVQFVKP